MRNFRYQNRHFEKKYDDFSTTCDNRSHRSHDSIVLYDKLQAIAMRIVIVPYTYFQRINTINIVQALA